MLGVRGRWYRPLFTRGAPGTRGQGAEDVPCSVYGAGGGGIGPSLHGGLPAPEGRVLRTCRARCTGQVVVV